ncbi:androgen-induced gene 1 protein-like isoform X1 [Hylaeus anthracinus]|uniref:androgen-induced gene 1 protein-like isoform X1 n=1 Tax=Hylaeus anthracinus TaxID=313031 RepID=UPI0023B88CE9|nr:androgen-induced gene 1 protein-like isoform X1 [Hylaeus anthracinus]XP_054007190.1 androgen-induced gene 1 protein-like isoform X1 [Hylaeus anthracinus]XP_054007191.1 androgen-induced gene 1 protein-like isoform X1 [Hylaeus anthracinus]XP_054007192.1 androgen-induced gene 1 protein-like isoform X1 [Hylaeus anthracinus]XP_054007193.1 androgen-induced gene 1 protein-like isoform X1 [Hylaeus anthracinus]
MRDGLISVFHVISSVQFAVSVYYDYTYVVIPSHVTKMHNAYGGKFKFLTFWDAIIQAVFFLICSLNDWFGTNAVSPKKPPFLRKLKDFMHAVFSFPVAMFVGVTFWSLMFVDRELVFPKAIDPYFPWWLNHLMHTMIMVSAILETILTPRKYPSRAKGISGHCLFLLAYLIWIHIIYYKSGIWVYPVMEVLSTPARIVFLLTMFLFSTMFYFIGETLDNFVWGKTVTSGKNHKRKKLQ